MTQALLGGIPGEVRRAFHTSVVLVALAGIVVLGALIQQPASTRLALLFAGILRA